MKQISFPFFLVVLILCLWPSNAQERSKRFSIGAWGGSSINYAVFIPKVTQEPFLRPSGGLMFRLRQEDYAGLLVELNYVEQGFREVFDGFPEAYFLRRVSFIDIPFLSDFVVRTKYLNALIQLGPQIGFKLREKVSDNLTNYSDLRMRFTEHHVLPFYSYHWGLAFGIGLEFPTKIGSFRAEGRVFYSLRDFFPTRRKDFFGNATQISAVVRLSYLIPIF